MAAMPDAAAPGPATPLGTVAEAAGRVLDGLLQPAAAAVSAPASASAYEMALLLDARQSRAALEACVAAVVRAGCVVKVAGPAQTRQPHTVLVLLHLPLDRCVPLRI